MDTRQNKIENRLAALREQRGLSAAALAEWVGVSRQAIYAIEAGTYVPNTALALRLARALAVRVDELFNLSNDDPQSVTAILIPAAETQPGQPVQLCRVDDRLMAAPATPLGAYLPSSDAVITSCGPAPGKARLRLHRRESDLQNRLLMAGCDPAMHILARCLQSAGVDLVMLHRNSSDALALLKNHSVHIAGTHLRDAATGESNVAAVTRLLGRSSIAVISFVVWREGIITAAANPKRIRGVEDLARRDIKLINREPGSGARLLLDTHLTRLGIEGRRIRGYNRLASGHVAAAEQVKTGAADCCVATEAAACVLGLHFLPLESARYDLVLRKHHLDLPAVETLLNTIAFAGFRGEITAAARYDPSVAGRRVI
jgi:molybdopterin molybdotransferase/putative molybdopterin biosynthesis protein